jgi:Contractile injection system tape measure protein
VARAKHIIKRQVIELQMADRLDKTAIQNRVSNIYQATIVPLLDKLLSDKSNTSEPLIIDRLEINIGHIPESRLEEVLTEKINKALKESLDNIKTPSTSPNISEMAIPVIASQENHSDAELVFHYLQTGLFPWWAQEATYTFLEKAIHSVLDQNSVSFKNKFIALIQDEEVATRLVYTFPDAALTQIATQFTGSNTMAFILPKQKQLFDVFSSLLHKQQLKEYWWKSLYQTIAANPLYSEKDLFEKAGGLFVGLAAQKSNTTDLLLYLQSDKTTAGILEKITNFTRHALADKPTHQPQKNVETHKAPGKPSGSIDGGNSSSLQNKGAPPKSPAEPSIKTGNEQFPGEAVQTHQASLEPGNSLNHIKENKELSLKNTYGSFIKPFTGIDKIYIQNAGLVLLWPFLQRFFRNMGLADDKTFIDENAQERACLLLQYLATGSIEDIFEAMLPLNKLLCGIPLLQPLNTQWTINDEEKLIAENFLLAVIQNGGQGWKNLSVNGFRQAYLNREGIITGRDGNWLLQVKRETYDILVDRLPWTVQIVKLPWMELLIFVEW